MATAKRLLGMGLTQEQVAKGTGLSIKEIESEYLSLGEKLGQGDFSVSKDFDRYSRIISDLRCAKVHFKASSNERIISSNIENVIDDFR